MSSSFYIGLLANIISSFFFYLSTFFLHLDAVQLQSSFSAPVYVFARQILGLVVFAPIYWRLFLSAEPSCRLHGKQEWLWVLGRAFLNLAAVFAFYQAASQAGAGKANILNMTYPIFACIFAVPILKEKLNSQKILLLTFCLLGILLNLQGTGSFVWNLRLTGSLWALTSAFISSLAIVFLRGAAKNIHPVCILFWMFLLGSTISGIVCGKQLLSLSLGSLPLLIASATSGVLGQWFLTFSYRSIDVIKGSIASTSRIPIALLIGFFVLNEIFSWKEILGSFFIVCCNILLAYQMKYSNNKKDMSSKPSGG